ncbi:MAG: hypothetical protein OSA81_07185 [Longimicrobiales bacterium]|nr:hypothetical protein [Longimicrobiales bacterium]
MMPIHGSVQRSLATAAFLSLAAATAASAQNADVLHASADELAATMTGQVVEWRRNIHSHPGGHVR